MAKQEQLILRGTIFSILLVLSFLTAFIAINRANWYNQICWRKEVYAHPIWKCQASDSEYLIGRDIKDQLITSLIKGGSMVLVLNEMRGNSLDTEGKTGLWVNKLGLVEKVGCL